MQAQERLMAVADYQVGAGLMKKLHAQRHIRDLRAQASGPRRRRREAELTRTDPEATRRRPESAAAQAAAFGIEVVEVKAKEDEAAPCT